MTKYLVFETEAEAILAEADISAAMGLSKPGVSAASGEVVPGVYTTRWAVPMQIADGRWVIPSPTNSGEEMGDDWFVISDEPLLPEATD